MNHIPFFQNKYLRNIVKLHKYVLLLKIEARSSGGWVKRNIFLRELILKAVMSIWI